MVSTVIVTAVGYASLILPLAVAFVLELLAWALLWPVMLYCPSVRSKLLTFVMHGMASLTLRVNPFWKVEYVRRPPKGYRARDTLIMFNHSSAVDPWVAGYVTVLWFAKFVYKSDLRRVPLLGWALALSDDIPLEFTKEKGGWGTKPGSVQRVMQQVSESLDMSVPISVFPEGTRSRTARLQLFKDGFFRHAVETKCEILPCFLHKTPTLWPCGSNTLKAGTAYVIFGDPTRPREGETADQLRDRVRQQFIELSKLSPVYDATADAPLNTAETVRGRGLAG